MAIGIGETLRAARREHAATLADAAAATRIRQRYLAALENDEFEELGEDVYVRGFLRNYAHYLGLDPEPLVAEYRARFQPPAEHTPVSVAPAVPERTPLPRPVRTVAAAGALVLLLAVVAVTGDRAENGTAQSPPPVTGTPAVDTSGRAPAPTASPTPTPTATAEATASPAPETPPAHEGVEVHLRVMGAPSWVRVVVDGAIVLETTLDDGAAHLFRAEGEVALRLGNSAPVHLTVNGEELGPAGTGEVVDLRFTAGDA